MAGHGLSSQEAQEKLHRQLEHLCHRLGRVDWLREIRQPPYTPLVCLGLALAGLLLVISFSLAPERHGSTLLQAVILLTFSLVNGALFCWEVYIIKTRRIRRLLSKVRPFLDTLCPWTAASYPSRSVNTLRGHFTVHAHRDGRLVNLPYSLVVQGDVIELYRDIPSPADATYLNCKGVATDIHVERGGFPPSELFQEESSDGGEGVRLVGEQKRVKFVVTQTPIIAAFRRTLHKKRATSVLTQQKTYTLLANNVLILIALGVSLVWNVVRYTVLPNDFGHWTEMILQLQVYTVLPLLHLVLPLMWAFMNLYGTAKIVLLTEKDSPPVDHRNTISTRPRKIGEVFKKMVVLVVHPSMYPNYRVFHILGSLTSLCSIDKEYVLTDSAPVPEKVFFLTRRSFEDVLPKDTGEPFTDRKIFRISTDDDTKVRQKGEKSSHQSTRERSSKFSGKLDTCVEVHVETASVGSANQRREETSNSPMCKSTQELEKCDKPLTTEMPRADSDSAILASVSPPNVGTVVSRAVPPVANEADRQPPNPKKMPLRFLSQDSATLSERSGSQVSRTPIHEDESQTFRLSQALSSSALSLASQFELFGEILDLSPDLANQSGLGFDDLNWESFLGSLKPIGINTLATSHCVRDPYSWSPEHCSEYVRSNLCKTNCVCPLGVLIGVGEYLQSNFTNVGLLFGVSDVSECEEKISTLVRRPPASLLTENFIQPHLLSSILMDKNTGNYLIMSRGSGELVAACCSDFWDGKDLQPMTNIERGEIEVFYRRRHLTSYCVTLAYNPLVDFDLSSLLEKRIGLYIPKSKIQANNYSSTPVFGEGARSSVVAAFSGEQLFSNLICNQVFLGIVSLQFQPRADIVHLIEDLESTGIRFVYFTNENEFRGKVFAEKLGLEAGWNCHISLAPGSEDEEATPDSGDEQELGSRSTSTSSSLNSVINAFQSYIRAKLPKGVRNIRPHLNNVDNVPLLVPLFTDCTVDAIREMIEIMQENGEVVMCLGNAWNPGNLSIFAQADVSLSIIPESASLQCCQEAGSNNDGTLSTSVSDNNFGNPPQPTDPRFPTWPNPLEMASYLNTALCQLCVHRQSNVRILDSVTQSRHIINCIRHGLLFGLAETLSISILMLAATIFFLPPPLSGGHIFMFLLFSIPLVSLSFLSSAFDPAIKTMMPSRKRKVLNEKFLGIIHFCVTFLPSVLVSLLLFGLTLSALCTSVTESTSECHPLLGNRNESSLWNGWRGENEQGLRLAQDITALLFSLHLVAHSIRFIHRTEPLWRLYRHVSWPYIASVSLAFVLQIIYTIFSQTLPSNSSISYNMSDVPAYVWVVGILWCVPLVFAHELLKYRDRKLVVKLQRHLKLEFETKLGMNSPF